MPPRTKVLLFDEGDLHVARAVLIELGVPFTHLRGVYRAGELPQAERLLVISARLAVALGVSRTRPKKGEPPVWMAFSSSESKSQRRLLRQAGFDYTIPNEVHPASLRLLMAGALYEGDSTQRVRRVPFGDEVTLVSTLRRQRLLMVEISPRGCRLLTDSPPKKGSRITLQVPCPPDGAPLQLEGTVVRTDPGQPEGGRADETAVGVCFDSIRGSSRERLKALLKQCMTGPRRIEGEASGATPAAPLEHEAAGAAAAAPREDEAAGAAAAPPEDELRVDAFSAGRTRVLVGRGLCETGMQVDAQEELELGERLRLALPVGDREEPLIIEAHVAQCQGERLLLLFDWMEPAHQQRLREFVGSREKIRRLEDDTRTHTAVPAALLPGRKRR